MTGARARPEPAALGAVFAGSVVGLTAVVDLVRLVRWALLTDSDPGWAGPRLLLGLGVAAGAAVTASAGVLQLVALVAPARRRQAAWAALGLLGCSGVFGARDALLVWPEHRATFDSFHGEDSWQSFGEVSVGKKLGRSDLTIETVRTYRLDAEPPPSPTPIGGRARAFRVVRPGTPAEAGERAVERVRDLWGRDWAVILGRGACG